MTEKYDSDGMVSIAVCALVEDFARWVRTRVNVEKGYYPFPPFVYLFPDGERSWCWATDSKRISGIPVGLVFAVAEARL